MQYRGNIFKMRTEYSDPINYFLPAGDDEIAVNSLLGKKIKLTYTGQINCIICGKKIKTSYNQGFCYSCLQTAPQASESILRPELSKAHFGIARDLEWAEKYDLIDHFVYLAVTSGLKVGVTRNHQLPYRWIDQGANRAIRLAKTPNRHIAGVIESFLKNHFNDRTQWKAMLQNSGENSEINLKDEKKRAYDLLPAELKKYYDNNDEITKIQYPLIDKPTDIKSFNLDKEMILEGVLTGIKGQYLIFDNINVINIRKYNGYYLIIDY